MLIVDKIDYQRGIVTLRPTRWERFKRAVRNPVWWLRGMFGPRVHTIVTSSTVTLADKGDVWNFRVSERVTLPDPWGDEK